MKAFNIIAIFLILVFYQSTSFAEDKCGGLDSQLKNAALKHLSVEDLKTKNGKTNFSLSYFGFFLKENARQEGRRVISHLMKCNKVKYSATKTLFSYTLDVELQ